MNNSLSIRKTAKFLGVSAVTLRRWEKSGKISSFRTFGNHRRFQESEITKINNK
jgi:MerR family regulatory protein.